VKISGRCGFAVAGGLLRCGICGRKMQGSWNNGKAHYRCVFLSEYAAKNKVSHVIQVLKDADPADRAEIYSRLGVTLTYHPKGKRVNAEVNSNSSI
jgi:hypothetical protein